MGIPSREELRRSAEIVTAWLDVKEATPNLQFRRPSRTEPLGHIRALAEAALRRVPPAPKDPRAYLAGDEFPPSGPYHEPRMQPIMVRGEERDITEFVSSSAPAETIRGPFVDLDGERTLIDIPRPERHNCADDEFPTAGV